MLSIAIPVQPSVVFAAVDELSFEATGAIGGRLFPRSMGGITFNTTADDPAEDEGQGLVTPSKVVSSRLMELEEELAKSRDLYHTTKAAGDQAEAHRRSSSSSSSRRTRGRA